MKRFDKGVSHYTIGKATIDISFPEDDLCCHWCPFCRSEETLGRFWCRLTNEMIYNPYINELGQNCPIRFKEDKVK